MSEPGALPDPLPLFPLGTVLYPGGLLPLRVFEPRYLDLVSRCLRERIPFGIVGIREGQEVGREALAIEEVGTLARLDEVDAEQPGLLHVRCSGGARFRRRGALRQEANGLWVSAIDAIADDPARAPGPAMRHTVDALAQAIRSLAAQGHTPFAEPHRLDDAGWVANRWCELLPISRSAKQKLLELEDPVIRLSLVDGYLRDKKVVVG